VHEKVVWLLTSRGSVSLREISARASLPTLSDSFIKSIRTSFRHTQRSGFAAPVNSVPAGRAPGARPGGARAFKPSQRVSAIDVVHKDFFDDWVKRHVEVYAQKFATVALRHQTEIARGSGYVAGMGVNSWTGENDQTALCLWTQAHVRKLLQVFR